MTDPTNSSPPSDPAQDNGMPPASHPASPDDAERRDPPTDAYLHPYRDDPTRGASEPGYRAPSTLLDEGAEFDVEGHVARATSIVSAMKIQNDRASSEAKVHPSHFQELLDIIHRFRQELNARL